MITIQEIIVQRSREDIFSINREVFCLLFKNTCAIRKDEYKHAEKSGLITYTDFIDLCHKNEVPYPLFFLDKNNVEKIVSDFEKESLVAFLKELYLYHQEEI